MSTPDNEKTNEFKQSARLITKGITVRTLIMLSPTLVSFGAMFFFRSNIGWFLGTFTLGFVFIIRMAIYFYDKNKQNIYCHSYKRSYLAGDVLGVIIIWWLAIYIFLLVPYGY